MKWDECVADVRPSFGASVPRATEYNLRGAMGLKEGVVDFFLHVHNFSWEFGWTVGENGKRTSRAELGVEARIACDFGLIALEEEGRWSGVAGKRKRKRDRGHAITTAISLPASLACQRAGGERPTINAECEGRTYG